MIVILTLINAFFAAAEISVVSLSHSKMAGQADHGDKKAAKLVKIMNDSSNFLATIQVGITFAGFFASASAATSLADYVAPLFGQLSWAHEAAVILVTILLSFFTLVFGELYPKQLALQSTEKVAKFSVTPISWLSTIMRPFVWLLSATTKGLMKLTPIKFDHKGNQVTRDEMISMVESGRKSGAIESDEYEMFEGIISMNKTLAREVMVPRPDAFMVDADDPDSDAIDAILGQIYSRIPVYRETKDNVIGIVHVKNLLKQAREVGFDHLRLEDIMIEPLFVPETLPIDDLLSEMRVQQQQMAILLDEYGGVVGLVTIEDLIEEIVGEIDDESDQATAEYTKMDETDYLVSGRMDIDEFNAKFHTELAAEDVDTLAGYVITQLGHIPTNYKHEIVQVEGGLTLTTAKVEGSRLVNVHVHLIAPLTPEDPNSKTAESD